MAVRCAGSCVVVVMGALAACSPATASSDDPDDGTELWKGEIVTASP
jgi:hypothetical protein